MTILLYTFQKFVELQAFEKLLSLTDGTYVFPKSQQRAGKSTAVEVSHCLPPELSKLSVLAPQAQLALACEGLQGRRGKLNANFT